MLLNSRTVELTRAFYDWERRGRGWDLYSSPVRLEPPYAARDFRLGSQPPQSPASLKSIFRTFFPGGRSKAKVQPGEYPLPVLDFFKIRPSEDDRHSHDLSQQLLVSLNPTHPVAFEVVGMAGSVHLQVAVPAEDANNIISLKL